MTYHTEDAKDKIKSKDTNKQIKKSKLIQ